MAGFQPHAHERRPCWHCQWYGGMDASGTVAICTRPGCCGRRTGPQTGCSAFAREVGADDVPEAQPAGLRVVLLNGVGVERH